MPVFPNNSQFTVFFREFVEFGYKCSAEAVVARFPLADGSRTLEPFSVGMSDGQTKIILIYAIVAFCIELELGEQELKHLRSTLCSFKLIRCCYEHFGNPSHHFLHSLSVLVILANKISFSSRGGRRTY